MGALLTKKAAVIALCVYAVIWFGGNLSFDYTHTCVRSHKEEVVYDQDGDTRMETVCDWYSANGHRWTMLDPLRAVPHYLGI